MIVRIWPLCALLALGNFSTGISQDAGEAGFSPEPIEIQQLEHIWKRSPFVEETKIVTETDPLAQKYSLSGIAEIAGEPVVFLVERSTNRRFMIPDKVGREAVQLVSVSVQKDPKLSSVVIKLGGEQANLSFDKQIFQRSGGAVPANQVVSNNGARIPNRTGSSSPPNTGLAPTYQNGVPPAAQGVPPPPQRVIKRPGTPVTPAQDNDASDVPEIKRTFIKTSPINTQQ